MQKYLALAVLVIFAFRAGAQEEGSTSTQPTLMEQAVTANNSAASSFVVYRKAVEARSLAYLAVTKKYDLVKDNLSPADLEAFDSYKKAFSAHFVDSVAFRSEARVASMKAGKYIEAARLAATVGEMNNYLNLSLEESAKCFAALLKGTNAHQSSTAPLTGMQNILTGN